MAWTRTVSLRCFSRTGIGFWTVKLTRYQRKCVRYSQDEKAFQTPLRKKDDRVCLLTNRFVCLIYVCIAEHNFLVTSTQQQQFLLPSFCFYVSDTLRRHTRIIRPIPTTPIRLLRRPGVRWRGPGGQFHIARVCSLGQGFCERLEGTLGRN
jgi:hypothetical protein